jgi:hypothetical protein
MCLIACPVYTIYNSLYGDLLSGKSRRLKSLAHGAKPWPHEAQETS